MLRVFDQRVEQTLREISGSPHHAYLFEGVSGVGKREAARWFAALLFCESGQGPCGECGSCRAAARGEHPDLLLMADDGEGLGIDRIRELARLLALSGRGGRRVAIIEEARRLTPEAETALLKSTEEPARGVVIVLTDSSGLLRDTTLSRVHRLYFAPDGGESRRWAEGRPGLARRLEADPEEQSRREAWSKELEDLCSLPLEEAFKLVEALAKEEGSESRLPVWMEHLRRGIEEEPAQVRQSRAEMIEALQVTRQALAQNANRRLALEVMVLKLRELVKDQAAPSGG